MDKNDNTYLYQEMPAGRAILTLALPTVLSQLITAFYNMADTFFIGQMDDPRQVAAATVATPLFVLLTAIANLFGIDGSSLISRSLGQGDRERARHCAAFSLWGAAAAATLYGAAVLALCPVVLPLFGTVVTLDIRYFPLGDGIPREVAAVGFPSFMMTLMGTVSNVVLNKLVSGYSSEAVAGMGIAKKIDTLAFAIAAGMTQGVLSLTGWNYASGNLERMREVIRLTFAYTRPSP